MSGQIIVPEQRRQAVAPISTDNSIMAVISRAAADPTCDIEKMALSLFEARPISDCPSRRSSESNNRFSASTAGCSPVMTICPATMKKVIAPATVLFHFPLYFCANSSLPAPASCRICWRSSGVLPRLSARFLTESSSATGVKRVAAAFCACATGTASSANKASENPAARSMALCIVMPWVVVDVIACRPRPGSG